MNRNTTFYLVAGIAAALGAGTVACSVAGLGAAAGACGGGAALVVAVLLVLADRRAEARTRADRSALRGIGETVRGMREDVGRLTAVGTRLDGVEAELRDVRGAVGRVDKSLDATARRLVASAESQRAEAARRHRELVPMA